MKLKWYGHSCFGLTFANGTTIVTDPFDASVGYPLCTVRCDAALTSHGHFDHNYTDSLTGDFQTLSKPGSYEVGGVKITGVASFHDEAQGAKRGTNVIFILEGDGLKIAHLGDLGHLPDAAQAAALADVDLLLIPIGGTYTLTTPEAVEVISMLKPRTAVAMHYSNAYCKFGITDESEFVRLTGAEWVENDLEVTPETLTALPSAILLKYE